VEVEVEGVHVEWMDLVSGKGSLGRCFAKDYDEDAIASYATPRHFDECEPGALVFTHHRRRHQ
jgi:hypothetical protein